MLFILAALHALNVARAQDSTYRQAVEASRAASSTSDAEQTHQAAVSSSQGSCDIHATRHYNDDGGNGDHHKVSNQPDEDVDDEDSYVTYLDEDLALLEYSKTGTLDFWLLQMN